MRLRSCRLPAIGDGDKLAAVPVILSAAVLIRLRVEPQPELAFPIAVALLGDVHDHGRLLTQLLQLRLRRSVTTIGRFSRNPDLVFELSVAPDTEDICRIGSNLRGALDV